MTTIGPNPKLAFFTAQARIVELEKEVKRLQRALFAAKDRVATDRTALYDCHWNPVTDAVDDALGLGALRQYDEVLSHIDSALSVKGA